MSQTSFPASHFYWPKSEISFLRFRGTVDRITEPDCSCICVQENVYLALKLTLLLYVTLIKCNYVLTTKKANNIKYRIAG